MPAGDGGGGRVRRTLSVVGALVVVAALSSACGEIKKLEKKPLPTGAGAVAWVANGSFQSDPLSTIAPVDLTDGGTLSPVTTASEPAALADVPGRDELLVANQGADSMSVVDTTTGKVTASVGVGLEPDAVATDGSRAVVANYSDGTVSVIDLSTDKVTATITVGPGPNAVAIDPSLGTHGAGLALVTDFGADTVTPVDLGTLTAMPAVPVGAEPDAVAVAGQTALVANLGSNSVTPLSLAFGLPVARPAVAVPGSPTGIAVAPGGAIAWVTGGAALTPITLSTMMAGFPALLRHVAEAVAITPDGTTAWVAEQQGDLAPVTLSSGRVGRAIHVGHRPSAIVIPD